MATLPGYVWTAPSGQRYYIPNGGLTGDAVYPPSNLTPAVRNLTGQRALPAPYSQRALPSGADASTTFAMPSGQQAGPFTAGQQPAYGELASPYSQAALPAGTTATRTFAMGPAVESGGPYAMPAAAQPTLADYAAKGPQAQRLAANATSITDDIAALRGTPTAASGIADDVAALRASSGGGGLMSKLGGLVNGESGGALQLGDTSLGGIGEAAGGLFGPLSPSGIKAGLAGYTGNGIGGALSTAAGRAGMGIAAATAGQLAGTGLDALGAPTEASEAARYAGTGAGLAAMLGPEAMIPGAIVGGAYGALKGPVTDLSNVGDYSSQVDTWNKAFNKIPDKQLQNQLGRWAVDAHKGHWNVLADHIAKNAPQFLGAFQQTVANSSGIDRHTQVLKFLTQLAQATTATNAASATASKQQNSAIDKDTARRMAIQNAALQATAPLAQTTLAAGDEQAAMARNMPGIPQDVANAEAARYQALAQQQANAFQGAVYAQPLIDQIQSQIALNNQYLQQLQASTGNTGSNDIADALKAAGITPKK